VLAAALMEGFVDGTTFAPLPEVVAPPPVPGAAHAARSAVSARMPAARRIRFMDIPLSIKNAECFTQVLRAATVPRFDTTKHC
jgi:hypothetical protein